MEVVTKESFRAWYVLPYMEQPERDPDFSPFFAPAFGEILRNGVQNYLSMVLRTCAPPKLLLVERWFRSEKQQQMRQELSASLKREEALQEVVVTRDEEIMSLQNLIRQLLAHMHKTMMSTKSGGPALGLTPIAAALVRTTPPKSKSCNSSLLSTDEDEQEEALDQISTTISILDGALVALKVSSDSRPDDGVEFPNGGRDHGGHANSSANFVQVVTGLLAALEGAAPTQAQAQS